jgi:putative salt-induced outer membrane protein YdiY
MEIRALRTVAVLAVLLAVGVASADTIALTNGDRLTGEIVALRDGKIVVRTAYAGEVPVDRAMLAGVDSEKGVTVWLASGDRLTGDLVPLEGDRFNVMTPGGAVGIAASDITGLNEQPGAAKSDLQAELDRLSSPTGTWKGKLELGALLTDGNTERLGANVALKLVRETPGDKFTAKAAYNYVEEDGERIADKQFLSLREDVKFDPWYVYALLSFERDEFEDLDLRGIFAPGAGRNIAESETFTADIEIGPTLTYNDYLSRDSEYAAELRLGLVAAWKVYGDLTITEDLQVFPSLTDTGEFRFISETSLEQPLGGSWFMKLSLIDRYNSDVTGDTEKNDLELRLSLVYDF